MIGALLKGFSLKAWLVVAGVAFVLGAAGAWRATAWYYQAKEGKASAQAFKRAIGVIERGEADRASFADLLRSRDQGVVDALQSIDTRFSDIDRRFRNVPLSGTRATRAEGAPDACPPVDCPVIEPSFWLRWQQAASGSAADPVPDPG